MQPIAPCTDVDALKVGPSTVAKTDLHVTVKVRVQVGKHWHDPPHTRLDQIALHAGVPASLRSSHAVLGPVALRSHGLRTIHVDELHA